MTGGSSSPSRRLLLLAGGATCLGLVLALLRGRAHEKTATPATEESSAGTVGEAARLPLPPARTAPPEPAPYKEETTTSDGLPIAPARGEVTGPAHPHPITPQHQRIYRENRLVGAIEGAMEVKDAPGMRRLLEQYRREYPEDDQDLQDGYGIIADCIEHSGPATRAAAERWLDVHNGSTAKRFVLRYCVEPPPQ